MDLLIVEPLDPEVVQWLEVRYTVRIAPELAREPVALRTAMASVRAVITPPSVAIDEAVLRSAPRLRAIGRLSTGAENIDTDACERAAVEIVRPATASAQSEAEFAIGAALQLLRRVPIVNVEGLLVGRELGSCSVGLVGMTAGARPLAQLLRAFGANAVGYDPGLHMSDALWAGWGVRPLALRELFEQCDVVCVLLSYFTRYRGLIGERYLSTCKPNQVLVSLAPSGLFNEAALAEVLQSGRMAAAWLDSLEPGAMEPGRPLHNVENLQVTPRVSATTRESRARSAWDVARRIDELLAGAAAPRISFRPKSPDDAVDLAGGRETG